MDPEARLSDLEYKVQQLSRARTGKSDLIPGSIEQRHILGVIITFGLSANRPTDGSTGVIAYFATDTNVLSLWNGTAWKATTLS